MATPAILTAAICGAETTRAKTPHLPLTAEELADEAVRCREAGASVIHLHVRTPDGTPTQDRELFAAALGRHPRPLRRHRPDRTGGAVGMASTSARSRSSARRPRRWRRSTPAR